MRKLLDFFHNFFIPHENNNFRARALHTDFLTFYLAIAILLTFGFKKLSPLSNVLGLATDITVSKLYELTNEQRVKLNLPILSYNDNLAQAASIKAADMFAKNYWAHFAPDGTTPWNFILGSGYKYEFAGENLAKNFLFSQGVVDAWMASPTHRENIIRKDYSEVGYAVVNGTLNGEPTTLVVQMFGKPSTSQVAMNENNKLPPQSQTLNMNNGGQNINPGPAVLAKTTSGSFINLSSLPFRLNLFFISFLLLALGLDLFFAAKLHVIQIGGKNLAHIIFVGFIFLGIIFVAAKGTIL